MKEFPVHTAYEQPTHMTIGFESEGAVARIELLWDQAPEICQAFVTAAPFSARAHHAIYSGSEIAAITPVLPALDLTRGTSDVQVGDLAYTYLRAADHHGVDEDFAEICWFYDVDARPSMFNGPAEVVVFGRLMAAEQFFKVSRDMRLEGAKQIRVDR
jgi:hypothetical protein